MAGQVSGEREYQCYKCGCTFTPTAHQISNYDYICKPCNTARHRQYKLTPEQRKRKTELEKKSYAIKSKIEEWRLRYNEVHRIIEREYRANSPKGREASKKHAREYIRRYPEKAIAGRLLRRAVAVGLITRPAICDKCKQPRVLRNGNPGIAAHHDDYSKPLQVRWLCPLCHAAWHRENSLAKGKEGPNG